MIVIDCQHFKGSQKRIIVIFDKFGSVVCSFGKNCNNGDCLFSRTEIKEEKK